MGLFDRIFSGQGSGGGSGTLGGLGSSLGIGGEAGRQLGILDSFDPSTSIRREVFSFATGGGAKKKKEDKRRAADAKAAKERADLVSGIDKDEVISDLTRSELLAGVRAGDATAGLLKTFESAQEGILPKFRARQGTQALFETKFDQPGRRQTVAASGNRNNRFLG